MPERSIEELLGQLPATEPARPDFEARLRARLTAELHADHDLDGRSGPAPDPHQFPTTEVIELQTIDQNPDRARPEITALPGGRPRPWCWSPAASWPRSSWRNATTDRHRRAPSQT